MKRTKTVNHSKRSASYEVVVNHTVKWRGRNLGTALKRLSRQYPTAQLTVHWIPGPELLVVIETL